MSTKANGIRSENLSENFINLEQEYGAHNYHPLPMVFERAQGCYAWDPEGRKYLDMLSSYSAVNQGHCHPRILQAMISQASKLTLSSRAFYTSSLGNYCKKVTELLGYEKLLPMNTGVEAVETALKIARKWAYVKKGVESNKAIILSASGNFHGRTLSVISMSTDEDSRSGFGPFMEGVGPRCPGVGDEGIIRYGHAEDLEKALELQGKQTAAFLIEPIQGEAGVNVPPKGYLSRVAELCKKHNVLLICDEIQTGLGRTGKMMCYEHSQIKPDIVTLGKALSGGFYPISAVLTTNEIMSVIRPGDHGSTFGGNPLACAIATAALDVIIEEDLATKAQESGDFLRSELNKLKSDPSIGKWIQNVRGMGLLNAIVIDKSFSKKGRGAWEVCLLMKEKGVLAKPTHENIIRLAPPLAITKDDILFAVRVIRESLSELDEVDFIPGSEY